MTSTRLLPTHSHAAPRPGRHCRGPVLALPVLVLLAAGCSSISSSGAGGSDIPRGQALEVRVESFNYDPPRVIGLVNEDHPQLNEVWVTGVKTVPPEEMELLLEVLEERGFMEYGQRLEDSSPPDPRYLISRVSVTVDGTSYAYTLPRRPDSAAVERYNSLQRPVTELFNQAFSLRVDQSVDGAVLNRQQQQLWNANQRKTRPGDARR